MAKLNRVQNRKVQDWVLQQWPSIEETRPSYSTFAELASDALGFAIGQGNIRGAVIALEKTWPNDHGKEPKNAAERELLLAMARAVGALIENQVDHNSVSNGDFLAYGDSVSECLASLTK